MSLGGKTVNTQQIDPALRDAALGQLDMARRVGQLGFVPYRGATVAGMQPGQIAAVQNTNAGLGAFGLNTAAVPTGENLSPFAIYQQQLAQMDPGQRSLIESLFINPMTGAAPSQSFGPQSYYQAPKSGSGSQGGAAAAEGGRGGGSYASGSPSGGGYSGIRDMLDGGGPGASGPEFAGGGLISDRLNRAGINPMDGRSKSASKSGKRR